MLTSWRQQHFDILSFQKLAALPDFFGRKKSGGGGATVWEQGWGSDFKKCGGSRGDVSTATSDLQPVVQSQQQKIEMTAMHFFIYLPQNSNDI